MLTTDQTCQYVVCISCSMKFNDIYEYQQIDFMKFISDNYNDIHISRYNNLILSHNYNTSNTGLYLPAARTEVEKN